MADYARELTSEDVAAAARALGTEAAERVRAALPPGAAIHDLDDLARAAPSEALGVSRGAWLAAFSPLFGEFE